MNFSFALRH